MLAIAYSTFIPPQWNSKRDISSFSIVTKESCRFTGKWGRAELMSEYVTVATVNRSWRFLSNVFANSKIRFYSQREKESLKAKMYVQKLFENPSEKMYI